MGDLLERLRSVVTFSKDVDEGKTYKRLRNPDGPEAADELSSLRGRLDTVLSEAAGTLSDNEALRERVEALEAAARLVVECDTPDAMKVANLRALLSQEGGEG